MDKIFINQLQLPVIIGVFDEERVSPQTLLLNIELFTDIQQAQQTDNIDNTLNYASVRQALLQWSQHTEFTLIESLAEHLTQKTLQHFPVNKVRLSIIKKPFDILDAKEVGITIERSATPA